MQPPTTTELQRHLHEERVDVLRSSMQRPPCAPRRALGAWMVSVGRRLAPDERPVSPLRAGVDASDAPAGAPSGARTPLRVVS